MKKLISLALALLTLLSLTACGGGKETAPEAPADNSAPVSESKDLPTINFWTTGSQNVSDVFTEVIAAYNAKEDRACNVELQFILSGTGDASLGSRYAAAYITGKITALIFWPATDPISWATPTSVAPKTLSSIWISPKCLILPMFKWKPLSLRTNWSRIAAPL